MHDDWFENVIGVCPVIPYILVDVKIDGDSENIGMSAASWDWSFTECNNVTHWRLHKPVEEFKGLETAYDTDDNISYKYPNTDSAKVVQIESSESKVAQIMCKMFDRNITELDVSKIVTLLNIVK